jgi:uroporphyrin-III C-methyltransferase/precorrin-2 dehydrogenase/sirohydrochlorin ferrochelatase
MSLDRLGDVAAALIRHGRPPATPVAVIADGTLPTQHTINATLQTVASRTATAGIRPPAVVVVGDVVTVAAQAAELSRAAATFRGPAAEPWLVQELRREGQPEGRGTDE